MSTNKRRNSADEAVEGSGEPHSASLRKKPRLSSIVEVDKDRRHIKPDVIPDEGARQSKGNKRPTSGHWRSRKVLTPPSPNSSPYSGPPEQFDVTPGLLDAISPADGEMSYWTTEHAAFIKSAAGLDDANWIGKRPLGSGTFGTAGLWERRDENNVVIEQIVIKESKTVPIEKWTGEVPEEVKMMCRMNNTDCQAVPDLIAYKRYMHVRKHRIYMEFCPYSDLATLNLNYKIFRAYLPEPFLWHTFNNLVKVAGAMENGLEDNRWGYQIVHRDLKPANIFLGFEDEVSGFPSLPVAKTGDWGLARKIKHGDVRNPIELRGAGTRAYYAPEQRVHCSGDALRTQIARHLNGTAPLPKLSARTNIWGIGAIMFELLTHEAVASYLTEDEWALNGVFHDIPNVRTPKYSSALTDLIRLCLMPDPWDRPSIEELELKIGVRCQSIIDEYAANPSLQQKDRLYYKGSEINQMPPGNWNYWNPVLEYVPKPSEDRSKDPKNPFTDAIAYPRFPTSELDGSEEEGGEVQDGDGDDDDDESADEDEDDEIPKGSKDDGAGKLIVISDDPSSGPNSNNVDNPLIISDSDEVNKGDESDESNGSKDEESSEGSSDDSDARRRMAIKKLPGT